MEGLTLEEVIEYQRTHPPVKHVYGKWGNLKKQYLIDTGKDWLIEDIPSYLHGIDTIKRNSRVAWSLGFLYNGKCVLAP